MFDQQRVRSLAEVEGYFELATLYGDFELSPAVRDRLVGNALRVLAELERRSLIQPGQLAELRGQAFRIGDHFGDAISQLLIALDDDPLNLSLYLALGWCYKRLGRVDAAVRALENAVEISPREGIVQFNLACYLSLAGRTERALEHLRLAMAIDGSYRKMLSSEADFDPIRDDPRFQALATP